MLGLMPINLPKNTGLSRRDMLRLGALSAAGMSLPDIASAARDDIAIEATKRATAKHCIYIFLCGGPSQLEMWDPKPEAPLSIRGPFDAIDTNVPGIRIGSLLPQVSQHADKFSIIRSMNSDTTSHNIGILYTLLASKIASVRKKASPNEPGDHPAIGAILHKLLGTQGTIPPWVVVPRRFMTGSRFFKGQTAGFLGRGYDPLDLNAPKNDSLGRTEFQLKNLDFALQGIDDRRFAARRQLLTEFEQSSDVTPASPGVRQMTEHYNKAFATLSSLETKQAFDVTREPIGLRERYGMNEYGQSFLLARRLVEHGVRMVNVFWTFYGKDGCQFNLWDNHGSDKPVCGGVNKGVEMLTADYCCPSFDRAFSTLLDDLSGRGLLDDTLVVVVGEFGRTPKINKMTGRDHWGACYSAVLAGGGVEGGQLHGASDASAAYVKDLPVSPYDLQATVLHAFGFGPEAHVSDATARPVRISDGLPVTALF